MQKTIFITCLLISLIFNACIVGTNVSIINATTVEKNISVYYPPEIKHRVNRDSLHAYDISKTENAPYIVDYYRHHLKIPVRLLDTAAGTYTISLKPGHLVFIEDVYPTIRPPYGAKFIIDDADTVEIKKKGSLFTKRPKLGNAGKWTYRITDTK
jgi:hypothetical protein